MLKIIGEKKKQIPRYHNSASFFAHENKNKKTSKVAYFRLNCRNVSAAKNGQVCPESWKLQ